MATIALDLETTGLDPLAAKPRLLITKQRNHPTKVVDLWGPEGPEAVEQLRKFVDSGGEVLGQNLKFDAKFLRHHYGIHLPNVWDTFRASSILHAGKKGVRHDLYSIYDRELGKAPPTKDLSTSDWGGNLTDEQLEYAASDVEWLFDLRTALQTQLDRWGLIRTARIENEAVAAEVELELAGFPIDVCRWSVLARKKIGDKRDLTLSLKSILPNPVAQLSLFGETEWNLDSWQQLIISLRKLGFVLPDTSEESLAAIGNAELSKMLLEYRGVAQAVKSFGLDYLSHVHPITGRIHSSYHPFTSAGRYACRSPNLQQLPRGTEFRRCFRPTADDNVFVICDYSQIELRIAAQISGDANLRAAYNEGADVHTLTAVALTGRQDKAARQIAKSANFGLLYGAGEDTLRVYAKTSYGVDMTPDESHRHREKWFEAYPGIRRWHRRAGNAEGVTRTLAGRLRHMEEDSYTERLNTPCQGTGADGLKKAMRLVWERLLKPGRAMLVNVVHDEIVLECRMGEAAMVAGCLEKAMVDGMQPLLDDVPVVAEACVANTWADK